MVLGVRVGATPFFLYFPYNMFFSYESDLRAPLTGATSVGVGFVFGGRVGPRERGHVPVAVHDCLLMTTPVPVPILNNPSLKEASCLQIEEALSLQLMTLEHKKAPLQGSKRKAGLILPSSCFALSRSKGQKRSKQRIRFF